MSNFAVLIKKIKAIEPHSNADAIELAVIDGYRSVVKKGQFSQGNLIAYIPESSLIPDWLLKNLGLWSDEKSCGMLTGREGNRVKAIRLRGELSQGICYQMGVDGDGEFILDENSQLVHVTEGQDVTDILGIKKYEPPIPVEMAGEVFNAGTRLTLRFDVENWKSYPDVINKGEEVIFTEKLHGTCTVVAILPYGDAHPEAFGDKKNILVFSKRLGANGLVFKNNLRNKDNLYVRSTRELIARIDALQLNDDTGPSAPLFIIGETFGPGVQDLAYGKVVDFRVFAAVKGYRGHFKYCNWSYVEETLVETYGVKTVPVLYRGPFSVEVMREHTDGKTVMGAAHIREGIVMVPKVERSGGSVGRVCFKSVSADYLTRKNATEFT